MHKLSNNGTRLAVILSAVKNLSDADLATSLRFLLPTVVRMTSVSSSKDGWLKLNPRSKLGKTFVRQQSIGLTEIRTIVER